MKEAIWQNMCPYR